MPFVISKSNLVNVASTSDDLEVDSTSNSIDVTSIIEQSHEV